MINGNGFRGEGFSGELCDVGRIDPRCPRAGLDLGGFLVGGHDLAQRGGVVLVGGVGLGGVRGGGELGADVARQGRDRRHQVLVILQGRVDQTVQLVAALRGCGAEKVGDVVDVDAVVLIQADGQGVAYIGRGLGYGAGGEQVDGEDGGFECPSGLFVEDLQ